MLLMRMYISATLMENNMEVSQKLEIKLKYVPVILLLAIDLNQIQCITEILTHFYYNIINYN